MFELCENGRIVLISLFLRVCLGKDDKCTRMGNDIAALQINGGETEDFGKAFIKTLKKLTKKEFSTRKDEKSSCAKHSNAEQDDALSRPFTVWHAVRAVGDSSSQASWLVVKVVVSILYWHGITCPWMRGEDLGVFGETPLHIALLFNPPTEEVEDVFRFLWNHCEAIREHQYTDEKYKGENVLHLAIVRNYRVEFFNHIHRTHRAGWARLLDARATGTFFSDQDEGCLMQGELPLFFAACCDRRHIFQFLADHGAKLKAVTNNQENLLHVMIRRDSMVTSTCASGPDASRPLTSWQMLDLVLETLHNKEDSEGSSIYESLSCQANPDGLTPIMLAAAEGSPKMFEHFFEAAKVKVAWVYGTVECVNICLNGIDPAFEDNTASGRRESLLELLVRCKRRDIMAECTIAKIIDQKWELYGSVVFSRRLCVSILYAAAVVSIPVFESASLRLLIHVAAVFVIDHITRPHCFEQSLLVAWVYAPLWQSNAKSGSAAVSASKSNSDPAFDAQTFLRRCLFDFGTWLIWQFYFPRLYESASSEQLITDKHIQKPPKEASGFCAGLHIFEVAFLRIIMLKVSFVIFVCNYCFGDIMHNLLHYLRVSLYAASGMLAFYSVLSSVIVFEGYGSLVFMLINTLKKDLPIFAFVYCVFLICFAYYHFLASNNVHSGLAEQGLDSAWQIFSAMVGEFQEEDPKVCRFALTRLIVMGISVTNYFFVTVVLVNLLIAFLTNTIEEISVEANKEWLLQRARIMLDADKEMPDQLRKWMVDLISKRDVATTTSFNPSGLASESRCCKISERWFLSMISP
jgi:hypothetical protein